MKFEKFIQIWLDHQFLAVKCLKDDGISEIWKQTFFNSTIWNLKDKFAMFHSTTFYDELVAVEKKEILNSSN